MKPDGGQFAIDVSAVLAEVKDLGRGLAKDVRLKGQKAKKKKETDEKKDQEETPVKQETQTNQEKTVKIEKTPVKHEKTSVKKETEKAGKSPVNKKTPTKVSAKTPDESKKATKPVKR